MCKCNLQLLAIDAHRHGLYDKQKNFSLRAIPVEKWNENLQFVQYERETKNLFGDRLANAFSPWLQLTLEEGVRCVLDWSGKHARQEVNYIYNSMGILHYSPILWKNWHPELFPSAKVMILPDERELSAEVVEVAKKFLRTSSGFLTLHALESYYSLETAKKILKTTTLHWLAQNGLLSSRLLLVHMNAATQKDFELIEFYGVHVVLCPATRMALQNPHPVIKNRKLKLHFGTDSPLVSGERSLWKQAALQYNVWLEQGHPKLSAAQMAINAIFAPLPTMKRQKINTKIFERLCSTLIKTNTISYDDIKGENILCT